jgi:hypothetical protein
MGLTGAVVSRFLLARLGRAGDAAALIVIERTGTGAIATAAAVLSFIIIVSFSGSARCDFPIPPALLEKHAPNHTREPGEKRRQKTDGEAMEKE